MGKLNNLLSDAIIKVGARRLGVMINLVLVMIFNLYFILIAIH